MSPLSPNAPGTSTATQVLYLSACQGVQSNAMISAMNARAHYPFQRQTALLVSVARVDNLLWSFAVSSTFVWLCISSVTTCSRAPQPHRQASCNALRRFSLRCPHSSTADGVLGQATAYRSKWTQFVCLKPAAIQRWSASSCCDGGGVV